MHFNNYLKSNQALREGNYCADFLAKLGAKDRTELYILDDLPTGLLSLLLTDSMGICSRRGS